MLQLQITPIYRNKTQQFIHIQGLKAKNNPPKNFFRR